MDDIDQKILIELENNSRIPLKSLSENLDIKNSIIYSRLNKMKEDKILEQYTIAINPEELGLREHAIYGIRLVKIVMGAMDTMFITSFAKYLGDEYPEVLFSTVGDDEQIWLFATFRDKEHAEQFHQKLSENEYIDQITPVSFNKILKGNKLFDFRPDIITFDDQGEYFDDFDEDLAEDEGEDAETVHEVYF